MKYYMFKAFFLSLISVVVKIYLVCKLTIIYLFIYPGSLAEIIILRVYIFGSQLYFIN